MKFKELPENTQQIARHTLSALLIDKLQKPCTSIVSTVAEKQDTRSEEAIRLAKIVGDAFLSLEDHDNQTDVEAEKKEKINGPRVGVFTTSQQAAEAFFNYLSEMLEPLTLKKSASAGVMRLKNGTKIDFWGMGNPLAGKGRRYDLVVIDNRDISMDVADVIKKIMEAHKGKLVFLSHDYFVGIKATTLDDLIKALSTLGGIEKFGDNLADGEAGEEAKKCADEASGSRGAWDRHANFQAAAEPLIKWLAENVHPHHTVLVTSTSAELLESQRSYSTVEHLKD